MGAAPSAPKPGAVVRPTRRRVPGAGGFPDRLEASSAAAALRAAARARPADRVVSLSPSCRAAAGTVSRATVSDLTPTAGGEDGGQVRRPEKSPPGRSPGGEGHAATTPAPPAVLRWQTHRPPPKPGAVVRPTRRWWFGTRLDGLEDLRTRGSPGSGQTRRPPPLPWTCSRYAVVDRQQLRRRSVSRR